MSDMVSSAPDTLLSTQAAARALGVSERTVQRMAAAGRLDRIRRGHRTVRYTAASVEAQARLTERAAAADGYDGESTVARP